MWHIKIDDRKGKKKHPPHPFEQRITPSPDHLSLTIGKEIAPQGIKHPPQPKDKTEQEEEQSQEKKAFPQIEIGELPLVVQYEETTDREQQCALDSADKDKKPITDIPWHTGQKDSLLTIQNGIGQAEEKVWNTGCDQTEGTE
ncbi:hypothetical protein SJDPG2_05975 [Porphyromonas gingivalis SJD2]|nr:hypothetical protein SJDPG2_05975 [Porphyromonas gingivalis SJD2]OWR77084.1 hypothetical protein SJDPG5_06925 [Porphyromonas gingivalis SJD5]